MLIMVLLSGLWSFLLLYHAPPEQNSSLPKEFFHVCRRPETTTKRIRKKQESPAGISAELSLV